MSDNFAFSLLSSTKPLCRDAISLACARICVRSKSSDEDVDCWPPRFENIFDDVFSSFVVVNVLSLNSQRSLSLVGVGGARSNTTNETETIDFSLFLFLSLRSCCCYV
jgi:hypothetical protein